MKWYGIFPILALNVEKMEWGAREFGCLKKPSVLSPAEENQPFLFLIRVPQQIRAPQYILRKIK